MNTTKPDRSDVVGGEGSSYNEAVMEAARKLGLGPSEVDSALDMDHFRGKDGRSTGANTVKVWAWPKDMALLKGIADVRAFMEELLRLMGFEARLEFGSNERSREFLVRVHTEQAAHLVGRQGATLDAVRTLLASVVGPKHPDWGFRIDIPDTRQSEDRPPRRDFDDRPRRDHDDRPPRRDHDDRPPRRDDRPRDDRPPRRDDDRRRGDRSGPIDKVNEQKLVQMVQKVAERVMETGEEELIRKELNSFARRLVHVTIANEFPGLRTESVGEGPLKQVLILKAQAGGTDESAQDEGQD